MNDFILIHRYNGDYLTIRKKDIKEVQEMEEHSLIITYNNEYYEVSESVPLIFSMFETKESDL